MPQHKVFINDFGRSSTYAIKKRAREEPCNLVIPDGEEDNDVTSILDQSRHVSSASSTPDNSHNFQRDNEVQESIRGGDGSTDASEDELYNSDGESGAASEDVHWNIDGDNDFEIGDSEPEEEQDIYQPLYMDAPIRLGESMVAILSFVVCHNLTGSGLCNLLTLISLFCPRPNLLKTTRYMFRKHFRNLEYPIVKHYFCSACFTPLATSNSICESCNRSNGISYFIEIPIVNQLQTLFQRRGFYQSLQHRFNRNKKNPRNIEDIYDAKVYGELMEMGFLTNPDNISFIWNTDGVPIFKSSGYQIWPLYLCINELPYAERIKSENIVLAGLWFGPRKPMPNLFLGPLHSALREIYKGVYINVPTKDNPVKVRGIAICGTCDLPAKALFLNMTQFNGQYGCPKCMAKGRSVQRVWTYPFERNLNPRTDDETRGFAAEASRTGVPIYGVKGPTLLSSFVYKVIRTTAVDSMHCVFAGVGKKLGTIFFDPRYNDHPASLSNYVDLVDSRLCALTPPSFLQRRPRSIKNHYKYWKANELKAWLFYYSLPILDDIMPTPYFEHYCMFVIGIFALHGDSISPETVECASRLLREFVNRFNVLYGDQHMSCNVHQLLHLHETVLDFGPLWVTSCFPFEDLNGKLKRLVHSSRAPELQICSGISALLNLKALRHQRLVPGSAVDDYCSKLANPKKNMKLQYLVEGISSIGRCGEISTLPDIVVEALARDNIIGRKFDSFSRLTKDGSQYAAWSYSRSVQYDDSCVQYSHNDSLKIGIIHSFIRIYNCYCVIENACECFAPAYAIIQPCTLSTILPQTLLHNVPELVSECTSIAEHAIAIKVEQLNAVCSMLKIGDTLKSYVAMSANTIEAE